MCQPEFSRMPKLWRGFTYQSKKLADNRYCCVCCFEKLTHHHPPLPKHLPVVNNDQGLKWYMKTQVSYRPFDDVKVQRDVCVTPCRWSGEKLVWLTVRLSGGTLPGLFPVFIYVYLWQLLQLWQLELCGKSIDSKTSSDQWEYRRRNLPSGVFFSLNISGALPGANQSNITFW